MLSKLMGDKMYKVKHLYAKFEDEDGHAYLVPRENYSALLQALDDIYDMLFNEDEDAYYNEFDTILEAYGARNLEGEEYSVVLDEDIHK